MDDQPHVSFSIDERSEISLLKKMLKKLALQIGLTNYQLAKLDIIISEITSNFLKHATTPGEILYREIRRGANSGVEIIGIDHGPGMHDPTHLMKDGVSTVNSMGTGMGAMKRLSDQFGIYSLPGWGTLLLSRIFKEDYRANQADTSFDYATLMVAYPGEEVCGDGLSYKSNGDTHTFLVTDGLGHGPHAHEASAQAVAAFQQASTTDPPALISSIHERIAHTRGAVGMVLTLDLLHHTITYYGIGNISLRKVSAEETKRGISTQGILGQNVRNHLSVTPLTWSDTALLVVHSDGIDNRWEVRNYPELTNQDPSLIAAALYKDHQRGRDDCAILVIKINIAS